MDAGVLGRLGRSLERLVFGPTASLYRRFVRFLLALTVVLAVVNGLVIADVVSVAAGTADVLWAAGGVVLTLFVLTGLLQVVVLARALGETSTEVDRTAAELQRAAAEIEETAAELETAANEVETVADEAAVTDQAEADPEVARETAADVKAQTEAAKETADEVQETVETERDRLPTDGADEEATGDASGADGPVDEPGVDGDTADSDDGSDR